jgi:hypothetical protein
MKKEEIIEDLIKLIIGPCSTSNYEDKVKEVAERIYVKYIKEPEPSKPSDAYEIYAQPMEYNVRVIAIHKCPVCGGNGLVPNGFYTNISGFGTTNSATPEICRSCNGTGIIKT